MPRMAKIFTTGGSQAVRLPAEFRFDVAEVYIWKDPITGNITLSSKPVQGWKEFTALRDELGSAPDDFLVDRGQSSERRNPFDDWKE